ncbi:glycerate dehydrogenase [Pediococcus argentinicus]|uniref:Glycerate dehydrogenase n=1 Tax=Pediococcus argentinicus TaxID=480391 RepID=A0A0R2N4M6_9LACO|nr:glycerate dehydrogenase [Pediococcus argentinicus]
MLDGYALNKDLDWSMLKQLGTCTLYDRTPVDNPDTIINRIGNAEVVLTHKTPISREILSHLPNLKYIGIMGTGFDVVDIQAAQQLDISVTNVPTYASDAVAQFTFALLLEVTSGVGKHNKLIHDGKWANSADFTFWNQRLIELHGKTLGLIGYGNIAQRVALIGHAFGMKVIFNSLHTHKSDEDWLSQVSLTELLKRSDVISLHVPLNSSTQKIINASTISQMRHNAIIINTARGKLINELDLAEALNNRKIAGAGLDVSATEPIDTSNPLLKSRNCYLTPHIAWAPLETRQRLLDITISNLASFIKGKSINTVK